MTFSAPTGVRNFWLRAQRWMSTTPSSPHAQRLPAPCRLTFEGGDGRGVDDHAPLSVLRFVVAHEPGLETVEVERSDEIELDHTTELVEGMRA